MMAGTGLSPLFLSSIFLILCGTAVSDDASTLLSFKATVSDPAARLRTWTANSEPCMNWTGILCRSTGVIFAIVLDNMNLSGRLNLDPLAALPSIQVLCLVWNSFTGPMPELRKFTKLRSVYLSANRLSGEIEDNVLDGMRSLNTVALSGNLFSGRIPSSLARMNRLSQLWLDDNGFDGEIPNSGQSGLSSVSFSNNKLEGKIPVGLSKMDPRIFSGNKGLCGPPTTVNCKSPLPSSLPPLLSAWLSLAEGILQT